ncbi:unnamed protein product [Thelazia callipaeda]|uniref:Uncharacterized protein n=1 Tax=Thelazia callipaeda TaxID=103827 RepID=A0A0N5D236_THECL|nr:unnamed protein product [Thelazia callipaeda]
MNNATVETEISLDAKVSEQFILLHESDQLIPSVKIEDDQTEKPSDDSCDDKKEQFANSDLRTVKCESPKISTETLVTQKSGALGKQRQLRKRRLWQQRGNGLCPPPPPKNVPIVDWTDSVEVKHLFPKTYNYVACAQARYSSQYLCLSKWKKESDFFRDKYRFWYSIIQKKKLNTPKEIIKAKQLMGQLKWLLDHCWEGTDSKRLVPEMLWRARKEEARRCEQLLIRQECYKRQVMTKRRLNAEKCLAKYDNNNDDGDDHGSSGSTRDVKEPSFVFEKKNNLKEDNIVSTAIQTTAPLFINETRMQQEQNDDSGNLIMENDKNALGKAHLFSLLFLARRWTEVAKKLDSSESMVFPGRTLLRNHIENYIRDLTAAYDVIKGTDKFEENLIREILCSIFETALLERNVLLKDELHKNGLESLTSNWVIFESKSSRDLEKKQSEEGNSGESSESKEISSPSNDSSTLLKVRDYLDDGRKPDATDSSIPRTERLIINSEVMNLINLLRTREIIAKASRQSDVDEAAETEILRPVPIKPLELTEDERCRRELQQVMAVQTIWSAFAETEASKCIFAFTYRVESDKSVLDAIQAVLSSCASYKETADLPLPKELGALRRELKFHFKNSYHHVVKKLRLKYFAENLIYLVNAIVCSQSSFIEKIQRAVRHLQTLVVQKHGLGIKQCDGINIFLGSTPFVLCQIDCHWISGYSCLKKSVISGPRTKKSRPLKCFGTTSQISTAAATNIPKTNIVEEMAKLPSVVISKKRDGSVESMTAEWKSKRTRNDNVNGVEMLATNRPKRQIKAPNRFVFDDEEEEKKKKEGRNQRKVSDVRSLFIKNRQSGNSKHNTDHRPKSSGSNDLSVTSAEPSNMETIVLIPEDESPSQNSCCSTNITDDVYIFIFPPNNFIFFITVVAYVILCIKTKLLALDVVDAKTIQEFKCQPNGIIHNTTRYIATLKNGCTKDINRRVYDLWTNQKDRENACKQQLILPDVDEQKPPSSTEIGDGSDEIKMSKQDEVTSSSPCSSLLATEPSTSSTTECVTSPQQNEQGNYSPWRQVAFRKEASLFEHLKLSKLKTQYDHLLMISEKNYLEKLCSEWMSVPEGGIFDERVRQIRMLICGLGDMLSHSNSTWKDYFDLKRQLQKMIDDVLAEFSALSEQASSGSIHPLNRTLGREVKCKPINSDIDT